MKLKDIILTFAGLLISLFLIYLSFRNVDFSKFLAVTERVNYSYIFLFFLSTFFEMLFRTFKWYFILIPVTKVPLKDLFKIGVISLGINNILPFRIGEITKMFLVSRFYEVSKTTVISTIFVERLVDTLILFALLLIYSHLGSINIIINRPSFIFLIFVLIFIVILFFIFLEKILMHKKLKEFELSHPKIHSIIVKIKNGGVCFKNPYLFFMILFTGVIQWNFDVLNNYFIAKALKLNIMDYFKSAISVFVGSLSASVPSMPGYFGNYEYAVSRVLMSWRIDRETAVFFATSVHILTYLIITVSAIIFIYSMGLNFRKVISLSKREK